MDSLREVGPTRDELGRLECAMDGVGNKQGAQGASVRKAGGQLGQTAWQSGVIAWPSRDVLLNMLDVGHGMY